MQSDLVGQTIKGYEILELVGTGGFANVYRARQAAVNREVAIKVILPKHANNPDFVRRFESEAQVVARLEHPYIVPLYDFWREPDGAFLVMRWLAGGSLQQRITRGTLTLDFISRALETVASALDAAHRKGVIHRDLKPGNILLDADGIAYLGDFGIAKSEETAGNITQDGQVLGSPSYFAPEQISGQQLSAETDIYSLGIMLYELLTLHQPFIGATVVDLALQHLNQPLPALSKYRADLPAKLDEVLTRATAKKPEQRYSDVQSLAVSFRIAIGGVDPKSVAETPRVEAISDLPTELAELGEWAYVTPAPENPYKGLRAFQEDDSVDFFGREAFVEQILRRMSEPEHGGRFIAVIGPSGSGKSSVVRAGLLPALRRGALHGSQKWFITDMLPGARPYEELEHALLKVSVAEQGDLLDVLKSGDYGLLRSVSAILPDDGTELLLVIDQFEEIFTLVDDERTRAKFLAMLSHAVLTSGSRLRVVITLRADFYDRPLGYPAFGDLVRRRTEALVSLSTQELQQAISRPAHRVGLIVADDLIDAMITDVGEQTSALPLLQYALTELYERRQGNRLSLQAYRSSGGVMGALARRAEQIYSELDEPSKAAARQFFLRLVMLGEGTEDTRRRVRRAELNSISGDESATNKVIEAFSHYRLLTFDRDPVTREPTIEVAHEALIRQWARLRQWLNESREDLRVQRRLTAATADWLAFGRDKSYLIHGARLEQLEHWKQTSNLALSREEDTFLRACVSEREAQTAAERARKAQEEKTASLARNFQRITAVLAVIGAVSLLALIAAVAQANDARRAVSEAQGTLVNAEGQLVNVQGTLVSVASTLTPIPVTLTLVEGTIQAQTGRVRALELASAAERELERSDGNPTVAALLAIRSLRIVYTPQGDAVLNRALAATEDGRVLLNIPPPTELHMSPDNKALAVASSDGKLYTYNYSADAVTPLNRFLNPGAQTRYNSVDWSPDGSLLVSGSDDSFVRLWDAQSGRELSRLTGHTAKVSGVAWVPGTKQALSGSDDGTLRLWDTDQQKEITRFEPVGSAVLSVAVARDGQTAAIGTQDKLVRLYDIQTGDLLHTLTGHTLEVTSVAFSPDGKHLASGSIDRNVKIWDVDSGQVIHTLFAHNPPVLDVAYSADGKQLMVGTQTIAVLLWDAEKGELIRPYYGHSTDIPTVMFSPDGKHLLSGGSDNTLRIWQITPTRAERVIVGHEAQVYNVAISPDSRMIISASNDQTARLWDIATGAELRRFTGPTETISTGFMSKDGKYVLIAASDRTARLYDAAAAKEIGRYEGHDGPVFTAALSPDEKLVGTCSGDSKVRLYAVDQFDRPLRIMEGHTNSAYACNFSPDGKYLATSSEDRTIRIWDVATGKSVRVITGHEAAVYGLFWSPDGKNLASTSPDKTVRIWDVETGAEIRKLIGHEDSVNAVAYSSDGRLLISASGDKTVRLWDAATGRELRKYTGFTEVANTVAFSRDDKLVISASDDRTIRIWDTDYRDFLTRACQLQERDLTPAERELYNLTADTEPTCPQFGALTSPMPATTTPVPNLNLPEWTPLAPLTTGTPGG